MIDTHQNKELIRQNWAIIGCALAMPVVFMIGPNATLLSVVLLVVFAPEMACIVGILVERPSGAERLAGRQRLQRIALWYVGMAIVGVAGYLGTHPLPGMLAPNPYLLPKSVSWALAMLVYIAMTGPLLRDRYVQRVPRRAKIILKLYSCTSLLWAMAALTYSGDGLTISLVVINATAILLLWLGWWQLCRRCSATGIMMWNAGLVCWLVRSSDNRIFTEFDVEFVCSQRKD